MEKETEKRRRESIPQEEPSDLETCSAQDCTGLIPAGEVDEAELLRYAKLYPFLPEVSGTAETDKTT